MSISPGTLARALVAATVGLGLGSVVLGEAARRAGDGTGVAGVEPGEDAIAFLIQFPWLPLVGLLLATKRPANPIGWLFLAAGLATGYASFADAWGEYSLVARPGALPAGEWVLWTGQVGAAGFVLPAVFVVLLFPDGRLPSPRWRPVGWVGAVGAVVAVGAAALRTGPLPEFSAASVPNPAAIDGAEPVLAALQGAGMVAIGGAFVAAAVSLVVRYRRAEGPERGRLTFLGLVATGLILTVVAGNLLTGGRIDDHVVLSAATGLLLMAGVPVAIAAAILWRGLYDLDRWVRRSLVYGLLWLAITAIYVTVAWAVGVAAGDRLPVGLAVLLTVLVTLVFEPARRSLSRLADRRVFGPRPSGYELTAALGAAVDDTDDLGPLAQRLAELVGRGVDARRARVTLLDDDGEVVATYPQLAEATSTRDEPAPTALRVPLVHRDQPLGTIECGLKQDGSGYSDDDRRLLDLLAREAALAAHGLRLAASLALQVDTVGQQARELAASRSRIIAAQEAERRRIERNIHDGAQQELVALIAKIRLARDLLDRDPPAVAATLTDVQQDAGRVLRDIRELAQGIHPTVLGDQGLVQATEDRTTRLPIDVRVHADATTRNTRYDDLVEGAAYFVVSEALANVLKHADAERADVRIAQDDGHLHIDVTDDGRGFESSTTLAGRGPAAGTGLLALADRLAALGGHLHVASTPGQGTTLAARLPTSAPEDPADDR